MARSKTPNDAPSTNIAGNVPLQYAVFLFDLETINAAWDQFYATFPGSSQYDEIIESEIERSVGREWQKNLIRLGAPAIYSTKENGFSVRKRVLSDVSAIVDQPPGDRYVQIRQLTQLSRDQELFVVFDESLAYGHYQADNGGKFILRWYDEMPPQFYLREDEEDLDRIKKHYLERRCIDLVRLSKPVSPILHDVHVFWASDTRVIMNPTLPVSPAADFERVAAATDSPIGCLYALAFPTVATNRAPSDADWLVGLFAPPGSYTFKEGYYSKQSLMMNAAYEPVPLSQQANVASGSAGLIVSPMAQLVNVGVESVAQPLSAASASPVTWAFEGQAHGALEAVNGQYFYKPPVLESSLVFNSDVNTLVPALSKASAASPVKLDVVTATSAGQKGVCHFLNLLAQPTHYFKMVDVDGALQLQLFSVDLDGREHRSSESETRWHVLAGNAQIAQNGIITVDPDDPSPYTVIWAQHIHDFAWLWGIVIVPMPMMAMESVIKLFTPR